MENPQEALGGLVKIPGYGPICWIAGITCDFHFNGMQQKIPPILFVHPKLYPNFRYMSFRIKPEIPATSSGPLKGNGRHYCRVLP